MRKVFLFIALLVITSCIIYSCDEEVDVKVEKQENQGELFLKDKFGINSFSTELIDYSEFIQSSNKTKTSEKQSAQVLNYNDGSKAYIITRGEEEYTVVYMNAENILIGKKDFKIYYNENGEFLDVIFKEHDEVNVKFYRLPDESYFDCVNRAYEDVTDTLWGKMSAMVPGGAPTMLAAAAVSCL